MKTIVNLIFISDEKSTLNFDNNTTHTYYKNVT